MSLENHETTLHSLEREILNLVEMFDPHYWDAELYHHPSGHVRVW